MKIVIGVAVFLFALVQLAVAEPFLACDLPEAGVTITKTFVEITNVGTGITTEVPGLAQISGANFQLLDLATIIPGKYRFRARWAEIGGLWSDYSVPFDATKPKATSTLRIVPK